MKFRGKKEKEKKSIVLCAKCKGLGKYQLERKEEKPIGYYDDEDGNLQMKTETVSDIVVSCEKHLDYYIVKNFEVTGTYQRVLAEKK